MPQPFLTRQAQAGERLTCGGCVEFRRDPADRRHWKLYHPIDPGANTLGLFVAHDKDRTHYAAGEIASYIQVFGILRFNAILRAGERVYGEQYRRGRTSCGGTPLVSAGDGTGALVPASRFVNADRICGYAIADLDLSEAEEDQLIEIQTEIYTGAIAEVG